MKQFFTADDFDSFDLSVGEGIGPHHAAELANEKLQREGVVVYGSKNYPLWSTRNDMPKTDTHRALLINIEEIEKKHCEHEPARNVAGNYEPACYKCNVKLKPTGWEEVK